MLRGLYDAGDGDRMVFVDGFGLLPRLVFGGLGVLSLLAPWELLIRSGDPFRLVVLPFWIISLGALSVGVPMLIGAVLGLERTLVVDMDQRYVVETTRGAFGLRYERRRHFVDLIDLEVEESSFSDGPTRWNVIARFATGKPWPIRTLETEAGARDLVAEIRDRMARRRIG